jgi:hypothetical protein
MIWGLVISFFATATLVFSPEILWLDSYQIPVPYNFLEPLNWPAVRPASYRYESTQNYTGLKSPGKSRHELLILSNCEAVSFFGGSFGASWSALLNRNMFGEGAELEGTVPILLLVSLIPVIPLFFISFFLGSALGTVITGWTALTFAGPLTLLIESVRSRQSSSPLDCRCAVLSIVWLCTALTVPDLSQLAFIALLASVAWTSVRKPKLLTSG